MRVHRRLTPTLRARRESTISVAERDAGRARCSGPSVLDTGGESHLERRFLGIVRRAGLPRPTCQVVHRAEGKRIARVDFEFPGTNVLVEMSGRLGHVSDRDRERDARRRNALQQTGHVVLEFTTAHVLDQEDYVRNTLLAQPAIFATR